MKISLPAFLNMLSERRARQIFREELREYLQVFNESNANHNNSQTKTLELICKKIEDLDKKEYAYVRSHT